MNKPVSVDFQFSIQQRGRGAKKQMIEGNGESKSLERIPRISRYMALAIHFEDLIKQGIVTDYADLARLGHVTRARVTQIMNLRLLAPVIQENLLLHSSTQSKGCHLSQLQAICIDIAWDRQLQRWKSLLSDRPSWTDEERPQPPRAVSNASKIRT